MVSISKRSDRAKKTISLLVSSVVSTVTVAIIAVLAESKVEITKLPPPAAASVDFAKDIKLTVSTIMIYFHSEFQIDRCVLICYPSSKYQGSKVISQRYSTAVFDIINQEWAEKDLNSLTKCGHAT